MPPHLTLSIIRYEALQRKEKRSSLNLSVVAIEKETFESPSTTVGQLTYDFKANSLIVFIKYSCLT